MTGNPAILDHQLMQHHLNDSPIVTLRGENLECVRNDMTLFRDLDFQLSGGELLQVVGPNGSGKTSLLRIVCGLAQPDSGSVCWNGSDIRIDAPEFRKEINYIGYHNGIKEALTPLENLNIARALTVAREGISVTETLHRFGLKGYVHVPVRKLSSGQRRRVALSRLLLSRARLWVLDEPFTALDDQAKQLIQDIVVSHVNNDGGMVMLATHDPVEFRNCRLNRIQLR